MGGVYWWLVCLGAGGDGLLLLQLLLLKCLPLRHHAATHLRLLCTSQDLTCLCPHLPLPLPLPPPRRGKTNFFERRVGEYQLAGVMQSLSSLGSHGGGRKHEHVFSLNEDF